MLVEVNFDGLVGPTHNYGGLSEDNLAASCHQNHPSNPREAALQGLAKMRLLFQRGLVQAVLPPIRRPDGEQLRSLGFSGETLEGVFKAAAQTEPLFFRNASAASSMWVANAATVAPSADTFDGRVHFTIANLASKLHRSLEASSTERLFRTIFGDEEKFAIHPPLCGGQQLSDEGAANHTRLCVSWEGPGLHVFVYGRDFRDKLGTGRHFWPRQTLEASRTVARLNGLSERNAVFVKQSPEAIDAGVFHNDVIAVGHGDFYLFHEKAYEEGVQVADLLQQKFSALTGGHLNLRMVKESEVSLAEAVQTYLFNSQILSLEGKNVILLPAESQENPRVFRFIQGLLDDPQCPLQDAIFVNLRQSMNNGGGPACLRLRVPLTEDELKAMKGRVLLDEDLYRELVRWVETFYRSHLTAENLSDSAFLNEVQEAHQALGKILELPL
jgi:succinylarginine dihydrolase